MKLRHVFLLSIILLLCMTTSKANAQQEELHAANTLQKYSKWGIGVDFSRSYFKIGEEEVLSRLITEEMFYVPALLATCTGPHINVYYNRRIARFLYYQPEITYAIYNYPEESVKLRSMFVRVTPLQLQFGVHTGWVRPYIFVGADLNVAISIRDMKTKTGENVDAEVSFKNFGNRLSWGYTYGGGVDFLSLVRVQYSRHLWMNDFTSFTKSWELVDEALCLSFFF